MKRTRSVAFVLFTVAASLAIVAGAVGAQEAGPVGSIAVVNGASTDPVNVTAGETTLATDLAYAVDGVTASPPLAAGDYQVAFTGTPESNVAVTVSAGSAQTVVSGYGDDSDTAKAYPITVEPIEAGMAKVTVWNARSEEVQVSIDDAEPVPLAPGQQLQTMTVAAGTEVKVTIGDASETVDTPEDSYTDVFAVTDTVTPEIAVSVVPSMTDLIAALAPAPPSGVTVPDVSGQPAAEAQVTLEAAGFVVTSTEQDSETVEAGLVIETTPAAGTEAPEGSTVTMVVSTGSSEPATVPVPDVVGQPAAEAQAALEAAGFVVTSTEQDSETVEAGLVIETDPSAGTEVAPGTTVAMLVSIGFADVVVPDFIGMTVAEATAAAEDADLTIRFVEDPDDPNPDGFVVDQVPEPGELVEAFSEVVAQLSPAVDDPWTILTVDPNRLMTVAGINFMPASTVELIVVGTNLSDSAFTDEDGVWRAVFDLSGVQNEAETLLVTGLAADGSEYNQTFTIPEAGQSTDEAIEEDGDEGGGIPWWGWALIGLGVIGAGVLIWWLIAGRKAGAAA